MTTTLHVGDTNRVKVWFYDTDDLDTPADPTSLSVLIVSPSGTRTTYVYGTDDEITRLDTGVYRISIPCTESKGWAFTITAAGAVAGVESGHFNVIRTA